MLLPCRSCRRHVHVERTRCPFCDGAAATRTLRDLVAPALALVLIASPASAMDEGRMVQPLYGTPPPPAPQRLNAVQADLGLGVIGLAYERLLAPRVALHVGPQVFGTWWGPTFDLPRFSGFGGGLRSTFFLTDDGARGLYVAPFFRVHAVSAEANGEKGRSVGWSGGVYAGWATVLADRFDLRIGAGGQYMAYAVDAGGTRVSWRRFHPGLDLVVGFRF